MRRRFQITALETERIRLRAIGTHCPVCLKQTELFTVEQAAVLAQVDLPRIHSWLESGLMHGATTPDGEHRICGNSMLRF